MKPEDQNIAICEALGRKWHKPTEDEINSGSYYSYYPDFTRDLNSMHEALKLLKQSQYNKLWSSNPWDHAENRYFHYLREILGIKLRSELVLSVDEKDRGDLNKRNGPYPSPIVLPPSAIVLEHFVMADGSDFLLHTATAAQQAEAFLKAIERWTEDE